MQQSFACTFLSQRFQSPLRLGIMVCILLNLLGCSPNDSIQGSIGINFERAPSPSPSPLLAAFAGNFGGTGKLDAIGATASFYNPFGVATDSADNVYVVDTDNHTIRKITPAGVVTTFAGTAGVSGSSDGTGATARFCNPYAIATDSADNVYVADTCNHTIRKITPAGVVTTFAGTAGLFGSTNATGAAARFKFPYGIATDSAGNVYVADTQNHTIRKITPAGVVNTLAGTAGLSGSSNGTGAAARFNVPHGIATDSAGNVYVADYNNHTIRKITPAGVVNTLAGTPGLSGSIDATGAAARFNVPLGIATDSAGNVYVAEYSNHTIRKITPAGVVNTLAGTAGLFGSTNDTGAAARFSYPAGIATDNAGNVYVADSDNHTIRKITPAGLVTTFSGTAKVTGSSDGTGAAARFNFTAGIATDNAGNLYVADTNNHTIRKITPVGVVSTLAGTAGVSGSSDGPGAAARFNVPYGIASDSAGNIYVADSSNHTIRKITPAGVVTTFAGAAGITGFSDGPGAAARFNAPTGVTTDSADNVYVAESSNHTIRKITPAGLVSTFAGTAGLLGSTDGPGAAARFNDPTGVATDSAGNVYVADSSNNLIRKITPTGVVTTLAGAAGITGFSDGPGAAARFNYPHGIAMDSAGNAYVADYYNHTIRKITATGVVTTFAGGGPSQNGFATGALPGVLSAPKFLFVIGTSLFITLLNGVAVVQNLP